MTGTTADGPLRGRHDVTFSVIVPTTGRRSLKGTLASIAEQLEPGDELLVLCNRDGDYGNRARQSLVERARGTHLVFMDDDDQAAYGALAAMRRFARAHPGRIGIFRLRYLDGRMLWREPALRKLNVSTQMFCVPNVPERLGSWMHDDARLADWLFIAETARRQGDPLFQDAVVAHIRADRRRTVRLLQRYAVRPARGVWRRLTRGFAARC